MGSVRESSPVILWPRNWLNILLLFPGLQWTLSPGVPLLAYFFDRPNFYPAGAV